MDSGLVDLDRHLDRESVEALFREYAPELDRFLFAILRNRSLVDDALQSTFVQLIDKGGEVDPNKLKAWLFRVSYNEAMMMLRREGSRRRAVQRSVWWKVLSEDDLEHGPDALIREETVEAVRRAIADLPETHRDIVRLRIYEGMKFAEIAERLDIPLGTALTRMRNSLRRLAQTLREERHQ